RWPRRGTRSLSRNRPRGPGAGGPRRSPSSSSTSRKGCSMDSLDRCGQVVTFYSFKGGVGRTMALANIAWILASSGRRVLTVDWDLESPGLHRYFAPFLADRDLRQSPGVINAIQRFADVTANGPVDPDEVHRLAPGKRYAVSLERFDFPDDGMIDYISPGQQGADYSRAVSTFDWEDFYLSHN